MKKIPFQLASGKRMYLLPPTVDEYYKIYFPVDNAEKVEGITDWIARCCIESKAIMQERDIYIAELELTKWLKGTKAGNELYRAPYHKQEQSIITHYHTTYSELKFVSDYINTGFEDIRKIDIFRFWRYYRDAVIYSCNKTEEGREYLNAAWNDMQDKPDREAIAALIAEGE